MSGPRKPVRSRWGRIPAQIGTGHHFPAPNPTPESPLPHRASAIWETTALPDGPAVLTATATDRAGNTASDSLTVTVDNTPPTVAVTTPPSGATVSGVVTVTGN